jgi:hypothetical protein
LIPPLVVLNLTAIISTGVNLAAFMEKFALARRTGVRLAGMERWRETTAVPDPPSVHKPNPNEVRIPSFVPQLGFD